MDISPLNPIQIDTPYTSADNQVFNDIKKSGTTKEQLKKAASEFESVFITKMLQTMDKTVDREEGGALGNEGDFLKNFKSFMFTEMGRQMAKNPKTSFGFASQIYKQMENYIEG